jgi:hypothetical protein
MTIRFIIRWILPLLVVLTVLIVLATLVITGTHAAGVTPDFYWHG